MTDSLEDPKNPYRAIERSPYRLEVLQLAQVGESHQRIADQLNNWDGRDENVPATQPFTAKQVGGYLQRTLEGGTEAARQIQQLKEIQELKTLAKRQLAEFKKEMTIANSTNDLKRMRYASENLIAWFDRNAKMEGIFAPDHMMQVNLNQVNVNVKDEAFKRAIVEVLQDHPSLWEAIKKRTDELEPVIDAEFQEK